jgi:sorting nexin-25
MIYFVDGIVEVTDKLSDNVSMSSALGPINSDTARIVEHSTYAHEKLKNLEEKQTNKTHALQALKQSQKQDSKV